MLLKTMLTNKMVFQLGVIAPFQKDELLRQDWEIIFEIPEMKKNKKNKNRSIK